MYLKRTVYGQLLEWKQDPGHSTLEVNGARQVGKTYIINKFADENFKHKLYMNFLKRSLLNHPRSPFTGAERLIL